MSGDGARVDAFISLQSDYCYFLIDRLLWLAGQGIAVEVRPVLGGVLRVPERYAGRDQIEARYFELDAARTARFLGLPHSYPEPSPIAFEPGSIWRAASEQPRVERLYRLFVGASRAGRGLDFLDHVMRMLWDGSTSGWDRGDHLTRALARAALDHDAVLAATHWADALEELDDNAAAMQDAGHWGVPLLVTGGEPFYGQDRFDQLVWRLGLSQSGA